MEGRSLTVVVVYNGPYQWCYPPRYYDLTWPQLCGLIHTEHLPVVWNISPMALHAVTVCNDIYSYEKMKEAIDFRRYFWA